ncbi:LR74A-like protein, partial [Mya arenaria]
HNTRVRVLDLEDTGLTSDGLVVLLNALRSNANITSLSLCENVVDGVGALALVDVLRDTSCLTHLSLSGAQLGEREMDCIASGFQVNSTLVWLDLSHNNISLGGAKKLGRALGDMRTLQYLDVSWNHIRLEGAVGLLKGIKHVNLAMNGLGFEGSLQLEPTLLENSCLRYLDVSHNRINWEGVSFVAKGLRKNATLRVLKIGHNPINMEGCYELLKAVAVRRSRVIHIGLENIPVNGAVLTVVNERVGVPLSDRDLYSVAHRLDKHRKGYISYSLLSNGVRNHIREERKEETRKEVKKRNRLEERRRILQTELPEIYKRKYDDDLFMFYASSTTGTPTRSRTGSTASHTGSQVPILPPIQSATSSFASALQADTRVLDETEVVAPVNGSSGIETPASVHWKRTTSSKGGVNNSYKLMWHINKYLERKKTQANFDLVSTDSTV